MSRQKGLVGSMTEHIKILNEFKKNPYGVLDNDKDNAKLIAAINKSLKLLQKANSRKNTY
jgi:hypothetical protein